MRFPILLAFMAVLVNCGGAAEPVRAPSETGTSSGPAAVATTAVVTHQPPKDADRLDLTTQENARATIYSALKRGDKAAFRKCVARERMARIDAANGFDAWYAIWKAGAERSESQFKTIVVVPEDGMWKLDEN